MATSLEMRRKKIEAYVKERRQYLADQEGLLAHLQITVPQVRSAIAMSEAELASVTQMIEAENFDYGSDVAVHRSPMDMLRSEYKGMRLRDIAVRVLDAGLMPMTTTDIARQIYSTENSDELSRARNSLSAELRNGVQEEQPMWQKIGRNAYASLKYTQQEVA